MMQIEFGVTTVRLDAELKLKLETVAKAQRLTFSRLLRIICEQYLRDYDRATLDAEFEGMATDEQYIAECLELVQGFAHSDIEAGRL